MLTAHTIKALTLCIVLLLNAGVQAACACDFADPPSHDEHGSHAVPGETHHAPVHTGMHVRDSDEWRPPCRNDASSHDCPLCGTDAVVDEGYLAPTKASLLRTVSDGAWTVIPRAETSIGLRLRLWLTAPRSPPMDRFYTPVTLKTMLRL